MEREIFNSSEVDSIDREKGSIDFSNFFKHCLYFGLNMLLKAGLNRQDFSFV